MSLDTRAKFYYGHTVNSDNYLLDFDEGAGELTAELSIGEYTLTDFAVEVERALNVAGTQAYTVTVDRSTRFLTISAGSAFDLLIASGSHAGTSVFSLAGFTGADLTSLTTYTSDSESGLEYIPQFYLQDYIPSENWQEASDASITKSANGNVEIVKFGIQKFVQFRITWVTNVSLPTNSWIENDPQGLESLQDFMQYIATKAPFEFMPDRNVTSSFQSLLFESSQGQNQGVGYKIKELTDKKLVIGMKRMF
jgi:hypothetical protein